MADITRPPTHVADMQPRAMDVIVSMPRRFGYPPAAIAPQLSLIYSARQLPDIIIIDATAEY